MWGLTLPLEKLQYTPLMHYFCDNFTSREQTTNVTALFDVYWERVIILIIFSWTFPPPPKKNPIYAPDAFSYW